MSSYTDWHKQYYKTRSTEGRRKLIELFGGKCIKCNSTDSLEFDHIDPKTLVFKLSGPGFNYTWKRVLEEAKKCQLLCHDCHAKKTKANGDHVGGHNKIPDIDYKHGTPRMKYYKKCKCEPCLIAMRMYKKKLIAIDEVIPGM